MKRVRMKQESEARKELRDREFMRQVLSNAHEGSPKDGMQISNASLLSAYLFVC